METNTVITYIQVDTKGIFEYVLLKNYAFIISTVANNPEYDFAANSDKIIPLDSSEVQKFTIMYTQGAESLGAGDTIFTINTKVGDTLYLILIPKEMSVDHLLTMTEFSLKENSKGYVNCFNPKPDIFFFTPAPNLALEIIYDPSLKYELTASFNLAFQVQFTVGTQSFTIPLAIDPKIRIKHG